MSLFDKITQSFPQVKDLFSKIDASANNGLSETNKAAPTNFWTNLFGGKNTTPGFNQNAGLNNAARQINLSNDDIKANLAREAARLNPSSQVPEYKEGVQANGTYIANILPSDVGKTRWSKEIDPADISRAALKKAAIGTGIANNETEAKQIVDNMKINGLTTHTNKGTRFVDKSDVGFGAWMKQHTIRQGIWQVQAGTDDIANLRDSARQLKIGNPDVAIANGNKPTQQANAGVLLGSAMALPKLAQQLPKAAVLAGEAAPPILAVGTGLYLGEKLFEQHWEVSKSNWEDAEKAKVMPLPMTMDDGELQMQPVPEAKPKDVPFAEPQAKPKVTDLPDAPTETTIAPVPKAKPQTKVDDLPQPYTPDVPKGTPPQSEPPKFDPTKLVPPLVGTATAIAGKKAVDAINGNGQSNPANLVFTGTLRKQPVELRNVEIKEIQYTKRSHEAREQLRADFGRKNGARESFLKELSTDPAKLSQLKEAGLSDAQIEGMKNGRVPSGWQVHHKLPLDDGGTNAATNLVLIKNDPFHLTVTNEQSAQTRILKPGETKTLNWVIIPGFVYPQKPEVNR